MNGDGMALFVCVLKQMFNLRRYHHWDSNEPLTVPFEPPYR